MWPVPSLTQIYFPLPLGYGIVTATDGENHDELSWIVKVTGVQARTGETAEALRSGDVFDTEFIQCGKQ